MKYNLLRVLMYYFISMFTVLMTIIFTSLVNGDEGAGAIFGVCLCPFTIEIGNLIMLYIDEDEN